MIPEGTTSVVGRSSCCSGFIVRLAPGAPPSWRAATSARRARSARPTRCCSTPAGAAPADAALAARGRTGPRPRPAGTPGGPAADGLRGGTSGVPAPGLVRDAFSMSGAPRGHRVRRRAGGAPCGRRSRIRELGLPGGVRRARRGDHHRGTPRRRTRPPAAGAETGCSWTSSTCSRASAWVRQSAVRRWPCPATPGGAHCAAARGGPPLAGFAGTPQRTSPPPRARTRQADGGRSSCRTTPRGRVGAVLCRRPEHAAGV
ncbi:hypothetical protein QJS66_20190 [Kocuria rhizophila]|nr:hypothetical protein QJS66_20190 [Kocuria rhizophila]